MKKNDIRILWNVDKETSKITDLCVAEFVGDPEAWPKHLYETYTKDTGNCWVTWKDSNIYAEILNLVLNYGFKNHSYEDKALKEFLKIDEFCDGWKLAHRLAKEIDGETYIGVLLTKKKI